MKHAKRIIALVLTVCTALACALPCYAAGNDLELIAHRGYSSVAPENTLAAVKEAGKAGFSGCEFDIRLTSDNVWVVSHDNALVGTTDSSRRISETPYDELKDIKITKGNGIAKYPNETIPTLTEMLDECVKWRLNPVIEIKGGNSSAIAELCRVLGARPEKNSITLISFNMSYLKEVKKNLPNMKCLYLTEAISDLDIQICLNNHLDGISFNCAAYSVDVLSRAQSKGLILAVWTVDDVETAKELYSLSVKSITSNTLDARYTSRITDTGNLQITAIAGKLVTILKSVLKVFTTITSHR